MVHLGGCTGRFTTNTVKDQIGIMCQLLAHRFPLWRDEGGEPYYIENESQLQSQSSVALSGVRGAEEVSRGTLSGCRFGPSQIVFISAKPCGSIVISSLRT